MERTAYTSRGLFRFWIPTLFFVLFCFFSDMRHWLSYYIFLWSSGWRWKTSCKLANVESAHTGIVCMTDVVCCVFNWASDVAVNRCPIPLPWFVKQIMMLWSQTSNRLTQATTALCPNRCLHSDLLLSQSTVHICWLPASKRSLTHEWASPRLHICSAGPICNTTEVTL